MHLVFNLYVFLTLMQLITEGAIGSIGNVGLNAAYLSVVLATFLSHPNTRPHNVTVCRSPC